VLGTCLIDFETAFNYIDVSRKIRIEHEENYQKKKKKKME